MPHVLKPDRSQPVCGHFTGGFDLACQRAGISMAAAVEINPACQGVLSRHFPATTLFEDVTEVTGDQLQATGFNPQRGLLTAGWPCQGNSVAGRRGGLADPRSGLWRHVVRILAETRPRWFLGENVSGLLSVRAGRDFATVIRDLDELGYGVAWRVLDAQWFGVPQRRRRVFIAGCLGDGAAPCQVLLEPESGGGNPTEGGQAWQGAAGCAEGRARSPRGASPARTVSTLQGGGRRGHRVDAEGAAGGHLIAYSLNAHHGRNDAEETWVTHALTAEGADASEHGTGRGTPLVPVFAPLTAVPAAGPGVNPAGRRKEDDWNLAAAGEAVRRLTPRECERLQGFPDDWTRWLAGGRKQSDSARYRELGNAIAVPVAEWIMRRIVAVEASVNAEKHGHRHQ
jgi:DNA (cytosine-5)-methyltransferase 1